MSGTMAPPGKGDGTGAAALGFVSPSERGDLGSALPGCTQQTICCHQSPGEGRGSGVVRPWQSTKGGGMEKVNET